jgi:hypothetical protein
VEPAYGRWGLCIFVMTLHPAFPRYPQLGYFWAITKQSFPVLPPVVLEALTVSQKSLQHTGDQPGTPGGSYQVLETASTWYLLESLSDCVWCLALPPSGASCSNLCHLPRSSNCTCKATELQSMWVEQVSQLKLRWTQNVSDDLPLLPQKHTLFKNSEAVCGWGGV